MGLFQTPPPDRAFARAAKQSGSTASKARNEASGREERREKTPSPPRVALPLLSRSAVHGVLSPPSERRRTRKDGEHK